MGARKMPVKKRVTEKWKKDDKRFSQLCKSFWHAVSGGCKEQHFLIISISSSHLAQPANDFLCRVLLCLRDEKHINNRFLSFLCRSLIK